MQCEFPSINADSEQIRSVFESVKTIAVIGLSPNPDRDSHKVAQYLQTQGYRIIPVYPEEDTILGEKVYSNLKEIPGPVDMVDVFRKPEALTAIVEAILERGDVKVLWTQLGIVNNQAAAKAQDAGLTVVQSLCAMVEHRRFLSNLN